MEMTKNFNGSLIRVVILIDESDENEEEPKIFFDSIRVKCFFLGNIRYNWNYLEAVANGSSQC